MAVRPANAPNVSFQLPGLTAMPLRPDFDWIERWEENRLNRPAWFYPWQQARADHWALLTNGVAVRPRSGQLKMFGTLHDLRAVRPTSAKRAQTFTDLLYGKLQLNPSYLNLGNVLNDQSRDVEMWNASFFPVTLTGILETNTDGVGIGLPSPIPVTLQPLQAVTFTVGVSTTGPTNMDALFTFDADVLKDVTLRVVGVRSVVFSIMPDTSKSYVESLEWVTDVITAHDGSEQRSTLNDLPDTQISMSVHQQQEQIHYLDSLLWGWQHRVYLLPLWHRHTALSAPVNEGLKVIPGLTAHVGFKAGGLGILWAAFDRFETFEVVDIQPDHLTIKRPLLGTWGVGTLVAACRPARLPQEVEVSWDHADLASVPLKFIFTDVELEVPVEAPGQYRNLPTMMIAPNWVSPLTEKNVRNLDVFETDLKARYTVLKNDVPYVVRSHAWFLKGKSKIAEFRGWLYSRRGRATPFWAPSWKSDLVLGERVEQGKDQITVKSISYRSLYASNDGRKDIVIFLRAGPPLFRRISNTAASTNPGHEILVLDAEISQTIELNQVWMICFLCLYRLDADGVELDWRSDQLALCNQNMRLLTDGT